jgi:hypothetical protein
MQGKTIFFTGRRRFGVAVVAATLLAMTGWQRLPASAAPPAPEALPPVTVRWEDAAQSEIFVIEGAQYQCRVATNPARILSLSVEGRNALEPGGIEFSVSDTAGNRYRPAPRDTKPNWKVWRRDWVPATNSRARMNIWNAGPYYWDAHLLDIPLVRANADPSLPPLRGEVVFHAHPDQLRIEIRINDGGDALSPAVATAAQLLFSEAAGSKTVILLTPPPALNRWCGFATELPR